VRWHRPAKIAFIGSHGIRKTTAAHAFASAVQQAGRSVEYGREVVRDNPLGINERATGEAQLWVLVSQIRQELELAPKAEILVLDRGVMDNFAYYLRATRGTDPYQVEPLIRAWSHTYDLVVRLVPDLALRPDGVRSTNDAFRDEIEVILDARLTDFVARDRIITIPASAVTDRFDWWPVAERLAGILGEPLLAPGVAPSARSRRGRSGGRRADAHRAGGGGIGAARAGGGKVGGARTGGRGGDSGAAAADESAGQLALELDPDLSPEPPPDA
jgi:nicotinamide riboside kinase